MRDVAERRLGEAGRTVTVNLAESPLTGFGRAGLSMRDSSRRASGCAPITRWRRWDRA